MYGRTKSNQLSSTLAAAAIALTVASDADAQTLCTRVEDRPSLHLEFLRPDFAEAPFSFAGATGAGFLTGRAPIAPGWQAVADLPFSRAAWQIEGVGGSASLIGNPYLGVEWRGSGRFAVEAGARLPIGDLEDIEKLGPILVGVAGELERMEAFLPETMGLYAAATYRQPLAGPLSFGFRGGSAFLTGEGGDEDLLTGYAGQLRYATERGSFGAGITGRANVTSDSQTGGERVSHQVIVGGDRVFGAFRPAAQLRFPIDADARDVSQLTIGLGLGYSFR
jgi:hypothetical protein